MSNVLAIAATTTALRNLLLNGIRTLDTELTDLEVTIRAPDRARDSVKVSSLNLFLYETVANGAWRNLDMPRQVKAGETGHPPLAINLHYLVTAYGRGDFDNDELSHRVLCGAMSVLHDHPVLSDDEIRSALANNDLADQIERVRITPLPLSIEEMSKLWSAFQTSYRVSAAYEATVLLIDSKRPVKAAMPVLKRGKDDRGVFAIPSAAPSLREARARRPQPAGRLGEDMTIVGDNLRIADATVRFTSLIPSRSGEILPPPRVDRTPQAGDEPNEIKVQLLNHPEDPDAFERWAPGFYATSLLITPSDIPPLSSNEVAFALAPLMTLAPNSSTVANVGPGDTLTLTCRPRVRDGQRVLIVFGERQVTPTTIQNPDPSSPTYRQTPTTITFDVPPVGSGLHLVRLRVDGVDSIPVILAGTPPLPVFDPEQQVRV